MIPSEDNDADYNEQEEKAEDVDVHDVTDADDDADAGADADDDFEKCVRPYCPHLPYWLAGLAALIHSKREQMRLFFATAKCSLLLEVRRDGWIVEVKDY